MGKFLAWQPGREAQSSCNGLVLGQELTVSPHGAEDTGIFGADCPRLIRAKLCATFRALEDGNGHRAKCSREMTRDSARNHIWMTKAGLSRQALQQAASPAEPGALTTL